MIKPHNELYSLRLFFLLSATCRPMHSSSIGLKSRKLPSWAVVLHDGIIALSRIIASYSRAGPDVQPPSSPAAAACAAGVDCCWGGCWLAHNLRHQLRHFLLRVDLLGWIIWCHSLYSGLAEFVDFNKRSFTVFPRTSLYPIVRIFKNKWI